MASQEKDNELDKVLEEMPEVKADKVTLEAASSSNINAKESQRKALVKVYLAEKKVPVTISPFYAPHLGRVVAVLVNGIRVDIPADGRTYQINETHAGEITAKIRRIDEFMNRQKRAGDITNNYERNIGELQI